MRMLTAGLCCATTLFTLAARGAEADVIELANGNVLQGTPVAGRSTGDGLALDVFDTGGVVIVKWEHVEASRRARLRAEFGIDAPAQTEVTVAGHRVRLANGQVVVGVATNPRDGEPLRLKTRTGTRTFERAALAGPVEEVSIEAMQAYTEDEYYRLLADGAPPDTPAAHVELAVKCLNFGAYDHAREHLLAAQAGGAAGTEALLRRTDVLIRAKGATELARQVRQALFEKRFNDAKSLVARLAEESRDPQILDAIGFDVLAARATQERDTHFKSAVASAALHAIDVAIDAKSRERRAASSASPADPGAAAAGSFAAARRWETTELAKLVRGKVAADLGLSADEFETYWTSRSTGGYRRASYGSGTFIVVKKTAAPKAPDRRAPGGKASPAKPGVPTAEEWWESASSNDRANWLKADFAQTGGLFEVIRTADANCKACGGTGFVDGAGIAGAASQDSCPQCAEAGVVRTVTYR